MECLHLVTRVESTSDGIYYNVCCDCGVEHKLTPGETKAFLNPDGCVKCGEKKINEDFCLLCEGIYRHLETHKKAIN